MYVGLTDLVIYSMRIVLTVHTVHRSALQRCDIARNVAISQLRNVAILFLEKNSQFRNVSFRKRLRIFAILQFRNVDFEKNIAKLRNPKNSLFNFKIFLAPPSDGLTSAT